MSDNIKNVFNEYTRLRLNGLDASEAVRALHVQVKELDAGMRDELARILRAWEGQRTEKISFEDREILAAAAIAYQESKESKIPCPNCGKANLSQEVICYSCGTLIADENHSVTDILLPKIGEFTSIDDARFGQNNVLVLMPGSSDEPFILRPQMKSTGLTFGRNKNNTDDVDVDLERIGASQKGVSRLHATITYNEISETLSFFDMGSTNGSYINGQKLQTNERRALRHGDEIRFGGLNFRVIYKADST